MRVKVAREKRNTISYSSIGGFSRTVAKKKRRKRSWVRALFLFVLTPFLIWLVAFLLWLYLKDVGQLLRKEPPRIQPASKGNGKAEQPAKNRSKETILEEDRRKLDEILKKQGG